jgi:LuxR family maltose regulon positive regulatory protein
LLASFEDAGALTALRDDVRRRLSLGRRRRRDPESAALTGTEVVVLRLLRTPKSEREIAVELAMSINKVNAHAASIYRKLGVNSRDEAVVRAGDLGLL